MKLASFRLNGGPSRAGVVVGDEMVDLAEIAPELGGAVVALLEGGEPALERVREAVASGKARRPLDGVDLTTTVRPRKFFAVGLNYADHITETGRDAPAFPTVFMKASSCVTGPFDSVLRPRDSQTLDYEGELGIVIGTRARHAKGDEARDAIAGYVVTNDVSVREWQNRTSQWTLGKSFDTHGPIGPWLVTADELPDPNELELRTYVNGAVRQEANTRDLIFDCFALVEALSAMCTLEPGDVIATGTPAGIGNRMTPPQFLVAGDVVRVEIEGIGAIENQVVDEG
jgi:2-keto-4-pentenoate hydratase/2-oxohepta-3-ene-1,7-dioic acid hydratase in catechol pathway